jgi:hypothetical protein
MRGRPGWWAWLPVLAVLLTACGTGAGTDETDPRGGRGDDGGSVRVDQIAGSAEEDVPSALDDPGSEDLPDPLVDVSRLISGGPPPDGIPAIRNPKFDRAADVDFLEPDEPVLVLRVGDAERAYPVQILIWHEIANDTIEDVPVVVSYCPLCNSALAYDRRVGDRVLTFGVSGRLFNSDLVMFDRQTESLWPQIEGRAVAGVLTGSELTSYPVQTVPWSEWAAANPESLVLNRDTGHDRGYGRNPYIGYDVADEDPFLLDVDADGRLPAKERVVGLGEGADAVAVVTSRLVQKGSLALDVGGEPVVLLARKGLRSALDRATVAEGRDVGATGAFSPVVDGQELAFERRGTSFVDTLTGSTWSVLGAATDGPLAGSQLEPVQHVDTFWFAWAAFQPDTGITR